MKFLIDTTTGKVYPEENKEFGLNDIEYAVDVLDLFVNRCYGQVANRIKLQEDAVNQSKWNCFKKLFEDSAI
jgi:hypothetical protein